MLHIINYEVNQGVNFSIETPDRWIILLCNESWMLSTSQDVLSSSWSQNQGEAQFVWRWSCWSKPRVPSYSYCRSRGVLKDALTSKHPRQQWSNNQGLKAEKRGNMVTANSVSSRSVCQTTSVCFFLCTFHAYFWNHQEIFGGTTRILVGVLGKNGKKPPHSSKTKLDIPRRLHHETNNHSKKLKACQTDEIIRKAIPKILKHLANFLE